MDCHGENGREYIARLVACYTRNLQRRTKYFAVAAIWVAVVLAIALTGSFLINVASSQINTIYVTKVNGVPNFANPGGEQFWSSVPSVTVPLVPASAYAPAGATGEVTVQMAWTDSTPQPELLVRMTFPNVGSGPSYAPLNGPPTLNLTAYPGSKLVPMYQNSSCLYTFNRCYGGQYPQDVGFLPLARGPGYVYPEQAIVILGIQPGAGTDGWYAVSYKPKMVPGTSGALGTGGGGSAEVWVWSSNPTDNSSQDTGYPGLKFPNGTALNTAAFGLPPHASYAIDGYANATSFYQLGGIPGSSQFPFINNPVLYDPNLKQIPVGTQLVNPFMVQAKGVYDPSKNTWTVEFARPLSTTSIAALGASKFQLQMNPKNLGNYYIAFAVSQGQASETYLIYYNSVSFWWAFNFNQISGFRGYSNQYGRPIAGPAPP
jgi:hypothetical protein